MAREINFDGLVGPTFNHGGFALGNLASTSSSGQASHPRQAALQGLAKMRSLHDLGVPQGVFPPHFRPELSLAHRLGFRGDEVTVLKTLASTEPRVLAACYSASSMWTANAATVSPSADSSDGRVHFTPANLQSQLHRSIEGPSSYRILKAVFPSERFALHEALPSSAALGDEGAANHTRFCREYGAPGLQFFVYGQASTEPQRPKPTRFPARQTKEACEALARLHRLPPERVVMAQQDPAVIDAGVFHNDVIAVGDRDLLLFHERAFLEANTVSILSERFEALTGKPLRTVRVKESELDVGACVATYLFNSQLVARPDGASVLVCPSEVEAHARARRLVEAWVTDPENPIAGVHFHNVRESMHGGGGPACLRLRVVLSDDEWADVAPGALFAPELHARLEEWVRTHYREQLLPADLADPALIEESRVALDELTELLGLGSIYTFQIDPGRS